jgi:hypothetical protein
MRIFMSEKLVSSEIARSRERFEKEFSPFLVMDRNELGYYRATGTQRAWEGWQAAELDTRERLTQEAERIRDKFVKLGMKANAYGADYVAERVRGKEQVDESK